VIVSPTPRSPVPPEVSTELQRVVQRWQQLPLEHALSHAGRVRALVQSVDDGVAVATGVPAAKVPDCGPQTLMDQLTVVVYDASLAHVGASRTSTLASTLTSSLARDLASLRSELR
jgi:hypothetical protein